MQTKINAIYFSPTQTTEKVVKAIAQGLGSQYDTYDLTRSAARIQSYVFGSEDIIVIGVPVYSGRIPELMTDCLKRMRGNNTPAVYVAVYGNRDYDDALLELKDILEANGFIGVAAGAFIGEHSITDKVAFGRPDATDLITAQCFGKDIKAKLDAFNPSIKISVKGHYPYKERKPKPENPPTTTESCICCGECSRHCPVDAIFNYKEVDGEKCIFCCSCIKLCPAGAKIINEKLEPTAKWLIDNCGSLRREPELFI